MTVLAKTNWCMLIGIGLMTASCSGSGSGGGGDVAVVPAGPSGAAPTPTPSPTPTPTPQPSYAAASDFTRDRVFTAIGYTLQQPRGASPLTRLDQESAAQGFDFTVATRQYKARYGSAALTVGTQVQGSGSASYDSSDGSPQSFTRKPVYLGYDANVPGLGLTYAGYVTWQDPTDPDNRVLRYLLFGARTLASDLPTAGTVVLRGQSTLTSTFVYGGTGATASLAIDYGARSVSGSTAFYPASLGGTGSSIYGPPVTPQPITLVGVVDPSTGRVSGTATYTASGATGSFEGALYGPRGTEVALIVTITAADGTVYYGLVGAQA
ncbi:hypothetical protein [Sphingomonas sp. PAMC 26621]|uniref:hypothetical protein n=1 Tax=Sphingomonas sp. PAMC 26621 TaxID=1112213 RepID=UPI001EE65156|nr:hypothetical protein [Sphingomonas sp. PAMC 26621]